MWVDYLIVVIVVTLIAIIPAYPDSTPAPSSTSVQKVLDTASKVSTLQPGSAIDVTGTLVTVPKSSTLQPGSAIEITTTVVTDPANPHIGMAIALAVIAILALALGYKPKTSRVLLSFVIAPLATFLLSLSAISTSALTAVRFIVSAEAPRLYVRAGLFILLFSAPFEYSLLQLLNFEPLQNIPYEVLAAFLPRLHYNKQFPLRAFRINVTEGHEKVRSLTLFYIMCAVCPLLLPVLCLVGLGLEAGGIFVDGPLGLCEGWRRPFTAAAKSGVCLIFICAFYGVLYALRERRLYHFMWYTPAVLLQVAVSAVVIPSAGALLLHAYLLVFVSFLVELRPLDVSFSERFTRQFPRLCTVFLPEIRCLRRWLPMLGVVIYSIATLATFVVLVSQQLVAEFLGCGSLLGHVVQVRPPELAVQAIPCPAPNVATSTPLCAVYQQAYDVQKAQATLDDFAQLSRRPIKDVAPSYYSSYLRHRKELHDLVIVPEFVTWQSAVKQRGSLFDALDAWNTRLQLIDAPSLKRLEVQRTRVLVKLFEAQLTHCSTKAQEVAFSDFLAVQLRPRYLAEYRETPLYWHEKYRLQFKSEARKCDATSGSIRWAELAARESAWKTYKAELLQQNATWVWDYVTSSPEIGRLWISDGEERVVRAELHEMVSNPRLTGREISKTPLLCVPRYVGESLLAELTQRRINEYRPPAQVGTGMEDLD